MQVDQALSRIKKRWRFAESISLYSPQAFFRVILSDRKVINFRWAYERLYCEGGKWYVELEPQDQDELRRLGLPIDDAVR